MDTEKPQAASESAASGVEGQVGVGSETDIAKTRLAETGRNDRCPCGSGKKYKKCHLTADEAAASAPAGPPDPSEHVQQGWRLFEQRRPGAAEKEFRAALEIKPDLVDAQVGIGLAKISAGDNDGARAQLGEVIKAGQTVLDKLRQEGAQDGFGRKETQPYLRASHALGCLAYEQDRYDDALVDFERVFAVDQGPVGTEARLLAGKTLIKLGRPGEAVPVLEPAANSEAGSVRGHMELALAHFGAGDRTAAEAALDGALDANPHLGKAVLGQIRRHVDSPLGASPGSREEAVLYAQTYGGEWNQEAKTFLEQVLAARAAKRKAASAASADEAAAG
jgi:tetratricopeptide (TPR) repeat protein